MAYEDYTQITREAPFLEDFRRRYLQGAFDLTKQPGTTSPERGIAGLDVFQTGSMDQYAANMSVDPKTGMPTGTGASFDPYFKSGLSALESAQKQYDPSMSGNEMMKKIEDNPGITQYFPPKFGEITGPGGPKDDKIPAMLSDGEFVMTAKAVDNAGGPKAMYSLMNKLDPESSKGKGILS